MYLFSTKLVSSKEVRDIGRHSGREKTMTAVSELEEAREREKEGYERHVGM